MLKMLPKDAPKSRAYGTPYASRQRAQREEIYPGCSQYHHITALYRTNKTARFYRYIYHKILTLVIVVAVHTNITACSQDRVVGNELSDATNAGSKDSSATKEGNRTTLNGIVVDFESCFLNGCQGVGNIEVATLEHSSSRSDKTLVNGAFSISIPQNESTNIILKPLSNSKYITTLQASEINTKEKQIDQLTFYIIQKEGVIYRSINKELSKNINNSGIYVGLALRMRKGTLIPVGGVTASITPEAPIRYLRADINGEKIIGPAFFDDSFNRTSNNGVFVATTKPQKSNYTIKISNTSDKNEAFPTINTYIGKGYITLGIHSRL